MFAFDSSKLYDDSVTLKIDIDKDFVSQIKKVLVNKSIRKLKIVIPENIGAHISFEIINSAINYENPNVSYEYQVPYLPEEIGGLVNLESLDISYLGLTTLPNNLGKLKKLKNLNISGNQLKLETELEKIKPLNQLMELKAYGCSVSQDLVNELTSLNGNFKLHYTQDHFTHESKFSSSTDFYHPRKRDSVVFKLLSNIYKYYPIGRPYSNQRYPGYIKLKTIIDEKISELYSSDKTNFWFDLLTEMKEKNGENQVMDLSSSQFPSYELMIPFESTTDNGIEYKLFVHLVISLLTDHYTIFFKSKISFTKYKFLNRPVNKKILFGEKNADDQQKETLKALVNVVKAHFPGYQFVNHFILFKTPISGGLPHGEDVESLRPEYPMFRFLFGLDDIIDSEIVE